MSKVRNSLFSIVDNLFLLQQYKWNMIKIWLLQLIINSPYRSILKNWSLPRGYFSIWGHTLVAIAIVERFK